MSATFYDTRIAREPMNTTLNAWLWIAQCLLAVFFLVVGSMHAFMSVAQASTIAAFIVWGPSSRVRISARRSR